MSLTAVAALAGLLLNAYSQNQSAKANDKAKGFLNNRINSLDAWYNGESSKDYTQTAEGQSTIKRLQSQMKNALDSQNNEAVKTGATAESKVAMQGELQEKYSDAISQLSGLSTQRKDNLRRDYSYQMNNLLNQKANMISGEQDNWANLASNVTSALGSISSADSGGSYDWLNNLFGNKAEA